MAKQNLSIAIPCTDLHGTETDSDKSGYGEAEPIDPAEVRLKEGRMLKMMEEDDEEDEEEDDEDLVNRRKRGDVGSLFELGQDELNLNERIEKGKTNLDKKEDGEGNKDDDDNNDDDEFEVYDYELDDDELEEDEVGMAVNNYYNGDGDDDDYFDYYDYGEDDDDEGDDDDDDDEHDDDDDDYFEPERHHITSKRKERTKKPSDAKEKKKDVPFYQNFRTGDDDEKLTLMEQRYKERMAKLSQPKLPKVHSEGLLQGGHDTAV
ncbi:hypothetical protein BSL78_13377 [Apostichopus japonicus]|uniref:Uncharacterized protein n=1 Tax=Stichopus japonicus TaxID=307972 RepID=A0A2G8KP12_STIJA|nr:hypothetical protein BSL78_13377 [Apostichopus japonicus]